MDVNVVSSTLLTVAAPLIAGYVLRQIMVAAGKGADSLLELSHRLKRFYALVLAPLAAVLSLWILDLSQGRLVALPVIGLVYFATGATLALGGARLLGMGARQRGAFFMAGLVSNTTSIGGLLAYVLFGEVGYALSSFFRLLESPIYFTVGYPVASLMGTDRRITVRQAAARVLGDATLLMPILGVIGGLVLNWSRLPRPQSLQTFNAFLIPALTILLAFAIGVTVQVGSIRPFLRPVSFMAGIKFLALPAVVAVLARFAGLNTVAGGLPYRVALLSAFMPVGFNALIPVTLFGLDEALANAIWLSSTLLMIPVLVVVVPLIR